MAARGNNTFHKLMQMAKEAENTCTFLLTNSKVVEGQFKALCAEHEALRAEAEALRRCLDRSGVLPADELEQELRRCGARRPVGLNDVVSPPPDAVTVSSASSASVPQSAAPPTPAVTLTVPTTAASQIPRPKGYPVNSARPDEREPPLARRSSSPRLGRSRQPAGESSQPSPPTAATAVRGRSPGPGQEKGPTQSQGQRPSSKSLQRPTSRPPPQELGVSPTKAAAPQGTSVGSYATDNFEGRASEFNELMQAVLKSEVSDPHHQQAMRCLQRLLKVPDIQTTFADLEAPGGTALSAAVKAGRADVARLLLKAQANPNERDTKGVSALHIATFDGNYDLSKVLVLARADVDSCDRHGQTPLFFAPTKELCKLLLERRSDVNVLNRRGQSALHLAGRAGLHEVLAWLSSRVSQSLVELKDVHGVTAKTYAKLSGVPLPAPPPIAVRSPSPSVGGFNKGRCVAAPRQTSPLGTTRSASARSLGSLGHSASGRSLKRGGGSGRSSPVGQEHAFDFFAVANDGTPSPPSPAAPFMAQQPYVQQDNGHHPQMYESRSPGSGPLPSPGQLPSVSELVSDVSTATVPGVDAMTPEGIRHSYDGLHRFDGQPSLEAMYAGFDNLDRLQQMRHLSTATSPSADLSLATAQSRPAELPVAPLASMPSDGNAAALTALAAAAALATAAVTTAAELTPRGMGTPRGSGGLRRYSDSSQPMAAPEVHQPPPVPASAPEPASALEAGAREEMPLKATQSAVEETLPQTSESAVEEALPGASAVEEPQRRSSAGEDKRASAAELADIGVFEDDDDDDEYTDVDEDDEAAPAQVQPEDLEALGILDTEEEVTMRHSLPLQRGNSLLEEELEECF